MSLQYRQVARTATPDTSIWRDISEATFREHLVTLEERTNAVPVPPQVFSLPDGRPDLDEKARVLPLKAEQKLADDLAYIVAVGEGAQSVSAVCVEEYFTPHALCFRVAAVDAVHEQLQNGLQQIGRILTRSALLSDGCDVLANGGMLHEIIVKLHFQKLLGRLRSTKWQKPKYLSALRKKPLWQDFANLVHRVQFIYPKKKDMRRPVVEQQLQELAKIYKNFEDFETDSEIEFFHLLRLVEASHQFCMSPEIRRYAEKLEMLPNITPQIAAALKALRQIEKIGAYRRIAIELIKATQDYPSLFGNVYFEYVIPYHPLSTDIGYEEWAKSLHIHAEIQLVVHYDLLKCGGMVSTVSAISRLHPPRLIGTSKYLCYLCYLFIKYHGGFIPANTHGRLYDQWTVPDLLDYDDKLVQRYRSLINNMDTHITEVANTVGPRSGKRDPWRMEPMTSRQNLLLMPVEQVNKEEKHDRSG